MDSNSKSNSSLRKGKVWIDLDNSPHVPFFLPVLEELKRRGHSIVLSARDSYQVCDLADLHQLDYTRVGRHYGKNKFRKVFGTSFRAFQLLPFALREKPNLAVSHGSRAQLLCSAMAGIPCLLIFDYEFAQGLRFAHPNSWFMAPEVIPVEEIKGGKNHLLRYPGIKEDLYANRLIADPGLRARLGVAEDELMVTLRPPASEAHYHVHASDELFHATVEFLSHKPLVKMVLLPRNARQDETIRETYRGLIAEGKLLVPKQAVDGMNLIWNSDLVISGGGTMNREAAALQVPVYSVFRGRMGAVDHYLAQAGRLVLLENIQDVHTKIVLARHRNAERPRNGHSRTLEVVVNHIEAILDLNGATGKVNQPRIPGRSAAADASRSSQ